NPSVYIPCVLCRLSGYLKLHSHEWSFLISILFHMKDGIRLVGIVVQCESVWIFSRKTSSAPFAVISLYVLFIIFVVFFSLDCICNINVFVATFARNSSSAIVNFVVTRGAKKSCISCSGAESVLWLLL